MRIKSNHYYVLRQNGGIYAGPVKEYEAITTGLKARNARPYVLREYLATRRGQFRLQDGHLPEHCPITSEVEALRWLDANPFQFIIQEGGKAQ